MTPTQSLLFMAITVVFVGVWVDALRRDVQRWRKRSDEWQTRAELAEYREANAKQVAQSLRVFYHALKGENGINRHRAEAWRKALIAKCRLIKCLPQMMELLRK